MFKTLAIVTTIKCPLRCSHCAVGINGQPKGAHPVIKETEMQKAIQAAAHSDFAMVTFTGGEPSLEPALLAEGIRECQVCDIQSAITTAPVWAKTRESTQKFLARLSGLDSLMLSYDQYHLKFLSLKQYENAINVAYDRGIQVVMNICYSLPQEQKALQQQISHVEKFIASTQFAQIIPIGSARTTRRHIVFSGMTIENRTDLDRLPRSCSIGNAIIGLQKDVYACCWASAVPKSPFRYDNPEDGDYRAVLTAMQADRTFQSLLPNGFLGHLTDEKKENIAKAVQGKTFVNECHLCMYLMAEGNRDIWNTYVVPSRT